MMFDMDEHLQLSPITPKPKQTVKIPVVPEVKSMRFGNPTIPMSPGHTPSLSHSSSISDFDTPSISNAVNIPLDMSTVQKGQAIPIPNAQPRLHPQRSLTFTDNPGVFGETTGVDDQHDLIFSFHDSTLYPVVPVRSQVTPLSSSPQTTTTEVKLPHYTSPIIISKDIHDAADRLLRRFVSVYTNQFMQLITNAVKSAQYAQQVLESWKIPSHSSSPPSHSLLFDMEDVDHPLSSSSQFHEPAEVTLLHATSVPGYSWIITTFIQGVQHFAQRDIAQGLDYLQQSQHFLNDLLRLPIGASWPFPNIHAQLAALGESVNTLIHETKAPFYTLASGKRHVYFLVNNPKFTASLSDPTLQKLFRLILKDTYGSTPSGMAVSLRQINERIHQLIQIQG